VESDHDKAVHQSLDWAGGDPRFSVPAGGDEPASRRRELFYGGFDWSPVYGLGGPPQAQCWYSDHYRCKQTMIRASRLDRQETYDANFRTWHWRLAGEQLAFSHQQFALGTSIPLYLKNDKPMLLLSGHDDTCARLGEWTREVAAKMTNTPGYARFLNTTGHSLHNEHPEYLASQIAEFLR
jgi:pimeloyl-ACP methyl ester carboxylesterase